MKYLCFLLLIISCTAKKDIDADWKPTPVDPARNKTYPVTAEPAIFETAFFDSTIATMDTFQVKFYAVNIGKLTIESGRVMIFNANWPTDVEPFVHDFPKGQFPAQLAVVKAKDNEYVAFSQVKFSGEPVSKWEFALKKGQKPMPVFGEKVYSYDISTSIGVFSDTAMRIPFMDSFLTKKWWTGVFTDKMAITGRKGWNYVHHSIKDHDLVGFSTGLGDGSYATYVGYNKEGKPCRLLTDFGLIDWNKKK